VGRFVGKEIGIFNDLCADFGFNRMMENPTVLYGIFTIDRISFLSMVKICRARELP
jgi:hypothetical protein